MERRENRTDGPEHSNNQPKKNIRRLQFSIRHLLALTLLVSGGIASHQKRVQDRERDSKQALGRQLAAEEWERAMRFDLAEETTYHLQEMNKLLANAGLQYGDIGVTAGAVEIAKEQYYLEQARIIWRIASHEFSPHAKIFALDEDMRNLLEHFRSERTSPETSQSFYDCWIRVMDYSLGKAHASRNDINVTQAMIDAERLKMSDKPLSE
ncbi:MAG TPA: hypothetical protein VHA78_04230 [Candidatus Peribacteraceae bacterium]|nr:hypothetical protein [Candidatus Peribacteraceae bacterium]